MDSILRLASCNPSVTEGARPALFATAPTDGSAAMGVDDSPLGHELYRARQSTPVLAEQGWVLGNTPHRRERMTWRTSSSAVPAVPGSVRALAHRLGSAAARCRPDLRAPVPPRLADHVFRNLEEAARAKRGTDHILGRAHIRRQGTMTW
eukprot:scaffold763_cov402-Prasinococcus_capsulatus_cf.AAC.13